MRAADNGIVQMESDIKEPSLRVLSLVKRWEHHTASGGYDRLAREIGGTVIRRPEDSRRFIRRVARFIYRKLPPSKPYLIDYRFEDWCLEWCALAKCRFMSADLVHVFYGDEQLDVLLRRRPLLPCPLVVTFHLPTFRVQDRFERIQKHLLSGIDAAVVLATSQLADFKNWLGADKVVFVPHGIDTVCFSPAGRSPGQPLKLIAVGSHMRDWAALRQIILQLGSHKIAAELDLVGPGQYAPYFSGCPKVRLHPSIPEEQLINMYRAADALLVPVLDATANNTVLESLACGTPVISSKVGGMPDYVDETCGWLFEKGEVAAIVELIASCCKDENILLARREAARQKALEFSWARVAAQMQIIYGAVRQRRSAAVALEEWLRSAGSLPRPTKLE